MKFYSINNFPFPLPPGGKCGIIKYPHVTCNEGMMDMYRKILAGLLALIAAVGLTACGNENENSQPEGSSSETVSENRSSGTEAEGSSSQPEGSSDSGESSDSSGTSDSSSVSTESEDPNTHTVILCNGLDTDVTALRIREAGSEYWSFEVLSGEDWAAGSSIQLDLSREEWTVDGDWEVEVTLSDGSTAVYEIPLGDYSIVELQPNGEFNGE